MKINRLSFHLTLQQSFKKQLLYIHFLKQLTILPLFFLFCVIPTVQAQQWPIIGNEQQVASAASNYTHIATATEDVATVPYVVFTEANIAKVKKYTDGAT